MFFLLSSVFGVPDLSTDAKTTNMVIACNSLHWQVPESMPKDILKVVELARSSQSTQQYHKVVVLIVLEKIEKLLSFVPVLFKVWTF